MVRHGFANKFRALLFAALMSPVFSVMAQTNAMPFANTHVEQVRAVCLQGRRSICGKVLKVFSEGLVVECGYTNLLREPLEKSWLVPGTVTVERGTNLFEADQPGAICVGLIFLIDIP